MCYWESSFVLIYLFLTLLGLVAVSRDFSLVLVHGLLIMVASLVPEQDCRAHRLQMLQHASSTVAVPRL